MSTNRKFFPRRRLSAPTPAAAARTTKTGYWGTELDQIILTYNASTDPDEREQLYRTYLAVPLTTLVECLTAKFRQEEIYLAELREEVLHYLVTKLENYEVTGGKSFSYFTVVAKHYIWQYNRKRLNYKKDHVSVEGIQYMVAAQAEDQYEESQDDRPSTHYKVPYPERLTVYQLEPIALDTKQHDPFVTYLYTVDTCGGNRQRDKEIVGALRYVFKHAHKYKKIHKKAILKKIRDMTDYKTEHIRRTIARIKENYKKTL